MAVASFTSRTLASLAKAVPAAVPAALKCSDLEVYQSSRKSLPDFTRVQYGSHFSDHMFECYWNDETGWLKPRISPLHNLNLHPAAKVFHYGQEVRHNYTFMILTTHSNSYLVQVEVNKV